MKVVPYYGNYVSEKAEYVPKLQKYATLHKEYLPEMKNDVPYVQIHIKEATGLTCRFFYLYIKASSLFFLVSRYVS
jgi:hypothetical protein